MNGITKALFAIVVTMLVGCVDIEIIKRAAARIG